MIKRHKFVPCSFDDDTCTYCGGRSDGLVHQLWPGTVDASQFNQKSNKNIGGDVRENYNIAKNNCHNP